MQIAAMNWILPLAQVDPNYPPPPLRDEATAVSVALSLGLSVFWVVAIVAFFVALLLFLPKLFTTPKPSA